MTTKNTYILAIESSCDDTAAAVLCNEQVSSNKIATQKIHEQYGGVVPELASRAHEQNIVPVVQAALNEAGVSLQQIDAIAFTKGPGLLGSLMVGASFAKSLSLGLQIPLIAVNHMQGHLLAHFIKDASSCQPNFPFLGLTISGGHTQIVIVRDYFDMELIGQTIDDAIGEAFDKTAKNLGLTYPGGPLIDKYAKNGNPKAFKLPKPKVKDLDFSFSGFKTAVMYLIRKETAKNPNFIAENLEDLCASVQYTLCQILLDKVKKAVKQTGITSIALGGGVSANSEIRDVFTKAQSRFGWQVALPKFSYTTDNAAMIGIAGYYKFLKKDFSDLSVKAQSRIHF